MSKKHTALFIIALTVSLALIPALVSATETYTFVSALYGIPGVTEFGPVDVEVDASGNIFVADFGNTQVLEFSSDYQILPLTLDTSNPPVDIAFDSSGNIYLAVAGAGVEKFSSSGNHLLTLGSYRNGDYGSPGGVVVDSGSNIYATDTLANVVFKFSSSGTVVSSFGGPGSGPGEFSTPLGIAIGPDGNFYVADYGNSRIEIFTSAFVYSGSWSLGGKPGGVEVDGSGNVYVSFPDGNYVEKLSSSGVVLSSFGSFGSGNGEFNRPLGLGIDGSGNVYVADSSNNRIQKINAGTFVSALYGISGVTAFRLPGDVEVDGLGNIFVADSYNNQVSVFSSDYEILPLTLGTLYLPLDIALDSSGNIYVALAGQGVKKFSSSGNHLLTLSGDSPGGVIVDSSSNIYITQSSDNKIYKFSSSGTPISMFGNSGSGPGQFNTPAGIAIGPDGNLYIADSGNNRIEILNTDGGYVGSWLLGGKPGGVEVDGSGNVYVSFPDGNYVEKLSSSGVVLSSFGSFGSGNGEFNRPLGLGIDGSGNVYVADSTNNRIQKFSPPTIEVPLVVLSPASGPSGTAFQVICSGFTPYSDITVTLPWSNTPYVGKTNENGVLDNYSVIVSTGLLTGPYTITATGTTPTGIATVTATFTVTPLNAFTFETISNPQTAGTPFSVKITAIDYQGNILTSYTGIVTLTCSNHATISPSSVTGHFVNGVWIGNIAINEGALGISITAKDSSGATGTSSNFNVIPGVVVPEYTLGALLALTACFAAFFVVKNPRLMRKNKL